MLILKRYKFILKKEGITGKDMAKIIGVTYGSYRFSTRSSATDVPKWVTSFVTAYDLRDLGRKR